MLVSFSRHSALYFELCRANNIKLHARKCHLFLTTVNWCGRLISAEGVRMDPSRLESLLRISSPKTAADLQQFVCAANWMRCCIPEFNKVTAVLSEVLEEAYLHAGKRTKRAIAKLSLREHTSWNTAHEKAFQDVKNALYNAATLAHPDPQKLLFIFTDASETHWAGVLTQIPPEDRDLPFEDHKNLIYIFNPVATNPHIAKHVANKIERWAMTMSAFK